MLSRSLRGIIFDIGRVLIRVDITRALDGLASAGSLSSSEVWSAIEKDPHWPDWQEGRMSPRDWHIHVAKKLGAALTFEQFAEVWNRALDPEPLLEDAFLKSLSKRYRLALLSNTDPIHVSHIESTYGFLSFFPVRVYSCSIGASKPNPLVYAEVLRACKIAAGEALYIDDVASYVEAAQRLGMAGIQFKSPGQLASDLQFLGVEFD